MWCQYYKKHILSIRQISNIELCLLANSGWVVLRQLRQVVGFKIWPILSNISKVYMGLVFLMFNNKMSWFQINDNLTNVIHFFVYSWHRIESSFSHDVALRMYFRDKRQPLSSPFWNQNWVKSMELECQTTYCKAKDLTWLNCTNQCNNQCKTFAYFHFLVKQATLFTLANIWLSSKWL